MNKTICPICHRELNNPLRPDFLLCPDCQVAVRVSGTLAKETDRLNVYSEQWVEEHSNNPIAKDIAAHTARVVSNVLPAGSSVVDIGCGSGLLVDRLVRIGYRAQGIDWSEAAIDFAKHYMCGEFSAGDIEAGLNGLELRYDAIVASHILEHMENPSQFLGIVAGLSRQDGYLVIAVPNLDWWDPKSIYRSVSTIFDPEHVVGYSPKGLVRLLRMNGYKPQRIITRTHRLAILTAVGITVYGKLFGGKGNASVKSGYVRATGGGLLAKVLAWGMTPWSRLSERGLKGMELIVVARKE